MCGTVHKKTKTCNSVSWLGRRAISLYLCNPERIFRDASPRPEAARTPAEILSIAKMQLTLLISETFSYPHSFTRNSTHTRRGAPGEKNVALCTGALPA